MYSKKEQWLICILFCGFLAGMMMLYLLLPKKDFSQQEKRYLAQTPALSWETLSTGGFSEEVDTYMADHIPGRNFFVGLNAYYDLLTGRQGAKDILLTRDKRLVEAPVIWKETLVQKNMDTINRFAQTAAIPVDLMVVPSGGWAAQEAIVGLPVAYPDETIIQNITQMAGENVRSVDVLTPFLNAEDPKQLYYKTDHHWTSLGAYTAYESYMELLGKDYRQADTYEVETVSPFYGSTYSRSALWLTPGEPLELWHGGQQLAVTHEEMEVPHNGVFFRERLEEADKYTVFLDGNHPLVRIENPAAAGKGKILVIRDSFSNCLGGFLAESYETVVLVDLRYYRQPVSELMAQEEFERVLVCYSIGNFLTDTNVVWLR